MDYFFGYQGQQAELSPQTVQSSSSFSDNYRRSPQFSDEEVMLASTHPKKRAGRKKFKETRHPVYRGIRQRNSGKWVCELREPNKKTRIWLGTYPTAEMAARAHDVAAIAFRGRGACLNFADSSWNLPIPKSRDTKDIQKAAAEAAEAFRPEKAEGEGSYGEVKDQMSEEATKEHSTDDEAKEETSIASNMQLQQGQQYGNIGESGTSFMDEEMVFGMNGLLADMYHGLMMPQPRYVGNDWNNHNTADGDDMDYGIDLPLWNY